MEGLFGESHVKSCPTRNLKIDFLTILEGGGGPGPEVDKRENRRNRKLADSEIDRTRANQGQNKSKTSVKYSV